MAGLLFNVELTNPSFVIAVLCIIFNPLFWNVVARWEHRTRCITRLFGSPFVGCYFVGALLIFLAIFRSHCFTEAMKSQPHLEALETPTAYYLGMILVGAGFVLVTSSFLALGFVGTYLGDYFGILMEKKVTGFPFNVMENPMYWGSTANYLGWALLPFTEKIYQNKEDSRKRK
ncbi:phosphatidylethanolamine N-methyltransferase isoform X2 [Bombina bombina]|uniref:phosphatidylethanolamine N-methyltransferase isoform X2 n=1 Tax=Bombina bombina TaxID=8345 RepID=UPI00235B1CEB|nr:phosphatidylethanolamine N-methyltransferase isoform X2 [Bombina bombina]